MPQELHVVAWPLLAGVILAVSREMRAPGRPWTGPAGRVLASRAFGAVCLGLLHLCVLAILVFACVNLARAGFSEWVEWRVLRAARLWLGGGGVYPDARTLPAYGLLPYGPLLFQIYGGVLAAFGGANAAVKLAAAGFAGLSAVLLGIGFGRAGADAARRWALAEILMVAIGIMGVMAKADILLMALASAACLICARDGVPRPAGARGGGARLIGLAVIAGLAAAIKLHGPFYVAPFLLVCLAGRKRRLGWATLCVAIAALVAWLPFLMPRTSPQHYLFVLRNVAQDGFLPGVFLSNLLFLATLVLCAHVLSQAGRGRAEHRVLLWSVVACGLAVCVFAAKREAGPHHLLPFLPALGLAVSRAWGLGKASLPALQTRRLLLALFIVSVQPVTSVVHAIGALAQHWREDSTVL